ncbi:phage portal protein [Tuanshanicoccus lijuaniae]|uniref:phage portal protein n=1 Tax=Aerococcaceae bacterium zg-1292 TaxID=2774330 RepID=UPI00193903AC|nr:phage portal protein [Aerococcaceae bacterium zg-1292]MBS4456320.1 phage portal protein [Aerococcaceae bacterium zg-A91]MBS4458093.1 phage portal protein [Aerococcaceae bacterium zg-BR33]MBS4458747.1 phage portal protein [Aerococcaceae bacterium zg-BR33]QQA37527.1 phage portal protein [Aerococcaceae bacterium zg-1292]
MANIFSKWFKPKEKPQQIETYLNTGTTLSMWNGSTYENESFRIAVDTIARNIGKIKPLHMSGNIEQQSELAYLLQVRPNEYMSAYDLYYKFITHLYLYNNAYIYIQRDMQGQPIAFYPIQALNVEFGTHNDKLWLHFRFEDGSDVYLPYQDVIHLRRHYNKYALTGDSNQAIDSILEVALSQTNGIVNNIKMGASIRGILKFTSIQNDQSLSKARNDFIESYMKMEKSGGVVTLDQRSEYIPIDSKPVSIDENQIKLIADKIYHYLGVNEAIISSNYDEDQWASFHASVIEPIVTQLSLEFTSKCFTKMEYTYGNRIDFDGDLLRFSTNKTKISLVSALIPSGLLTINQALGILNLPLIDSAEGDKRLVTLNYTELDSLKEYQGVSSLNERDKNSDNTDE